jgi:glycine/D-amino acid oxidase-like deaminating enzyme/nitrite reductase/ring-hydroxylating ferredoxin subunit
MFLRTMHKLDKNNYRRPAMGVRRSTSSGSTTASWLFTATIPTYHPLSHDTETDVCVVGAGIAGLTTAYLLCREGKRVLVLEDGVIGSGETGRTTAHLSNAFDDRYYEIERMHGEEGSRTLAQSHTAAIEQIAKIIKDENISCDFEYLDGYLFSPDDEKELEKELLATRRAGIDATLVPRTPLTFDTGPAIRFPRQATFHPLKYLAGLAKAITRHGGIICTNSHVTTITDGAPCIVETAAGKRIVAKYVVVATNSPINKRFAIHTKQAPYRTFVVALRVPTGSVPKALYWDTLDPYHYVRLQHVPRKNAPAYDLLIVGGEDHKTGQEDDAESRFKKLEHWARDRFEHTGKVEFHWSGQVLEPVDGVAFIGKTPAEEHTYIATGDSGNGMTHGTIAGILLTDLICGRKNTWTDLYDPERIRFHPSAAKEFAKENLNVAVQYTDYLTGSDVDSLREIKRGEGAVVQRGTSKLAMYRDERGTVHECSAVCPHLGCIVAWNSTEKSWDCPCHGSRFDPYGMVLNGPASTPLAPVEKEADEQRAGASTSV